MIEKHNISPYHKVITKSCKVGIEGDLVGIRVIETYRGQKLVSTLHVQEVDPAIVRQMPQLQRRTTLFEKVKSLFQHLNITVKNGPNIQR